MEKTYQMGRDDESVVWLQPTKYVNIDDLFTLFIATGKFFRLTIG
jgi:hypothetical protein